MDEKNFQTAEIALTGVKEILRSNFFDDRHRWAAEAAFTLLMVKLNDLIQILSKNDMRITFSDEIPADAGVADVTDLISKLRNAVCHIGSPLRNVDVGAAWFCVAIGVGTVLRTPTMKMDNEYSDDVAFFYGPYKILLNRQLKRAVAEAEVALHQKGEAEGWGSRPGCIESMSYIGQAIIGATINVDGATFENCSMEQCTLIYSGGALPVFRNNTITECSWTFAGSAENTSGFLRYMYNIGASDLVEQFLGHIRQPL